MGKIGLGPGLGFSSGAKVYAGPLDAFSGLLYSVGGPNRAFAAYTGPCWRVRRSLDNAEADIGFDATGWAHKAQMLEVAAGGSLTVVTDYDKTGGGHHYSQATGAAQPRVVNAGVVDVGANGHPAMVFTGAQYLEVQGALGFARNTAATTVAAVARCTNAAGVPTIVAATQSAVASVRVGLIYTSSIQMSLFSKSVDAGTTSQIARAVTLGAWSSIIGRSRFAVGTAGLNVDGSATSGAITPAQNSPDTDGLLTVQIGRHPNGAGLMVGEIGSIVLARANLDTAFDAALARMMP